MNVDVFLSGTAVGEADVRGRTAVVIDVLRASSTIATALANGAQTVIAVKDQAGADAHMAGLEPGSFLLCGERDAEKIAGYDLGNSPLEYATDVVGGKTVILNTTNGTAALTRAKAARHLVTGCFLNAGAVVDFIREAGQDVALVCAGWRGRASLEDTLCAGFLLSRLWDGRPPDTVSDAAHLALTLHAATTRPPRQALDDCRAARLLRTLGAEADLDYCLRTDVLPVLPYSQDGRLGLLV